MWSVFLGDNWDNNFCGDDAKSWKEAGASVGSVIYFRLQVCSFISFADSLFQCGLGSLDEFSKCSHWPKNPGKQTSRAHGLQHMRPFLLHSCQAQVGQNQDSVSLFCTSLCCQVSKVFSRLMHVTFLGASLSLTYSCFLFSNYVWLVPFLNWIFPSLSRYLASWGIFSYTELAIFIASNCTW
jgi:hypothetical protein